MDKIHKFSPIIKQKFGLVFGGHYKLFGSFSFITLILLVIFWLISGVPFAGFASLISVGILSFSILMLFLGIFSQYLGLIYEEVKNRPIYIVAERINHEQ